MTKTFLPWMAATVLLSVSAVCGQDLVKNPDFEFDGETLKAWRFSFYASGGAQTDWKETGKLKVEPADGGLLIEQYEHEGMVTFYQSAAEFEPGMRYKVSLTYNDSDADGKLMVFLDGGSQGVQGATPLTFPHSTDAKKMVTNSVELEIPATATKEELARTMFQLRVMTKGKVLIGSLKAEAL